MAGREKQTSQKNGIQMVLIICAVLVILLLAAVVILLVTRESGEANGSGVQVQEETKREVLVNADNAEEVAESMVQAASEFVEPGYYTVDMSMEWHFSSGDAASKDAIVNNQEKNTNDVYFDVFLAGDESEPIYESPVIPRGGSLDKIKLDRSLEAGTYDCVIVYHLVDEEQNTISTLRVAFQIIVES